MITRHGGARPRSRRNISGFPRPGTTSGGSNTANRRPLGIFSWFRHPTPVEDRLRAIKQAGFDATTLWWGHAEDSPNGLQDSLPAMVRDHGLFLENIHVPFEQCNDLWSDSASTRDNIVGRHLQWLEDCARHRIPTMVMHVSKGKPRRPPGAHGVESLLTILTAAEAVGVTIAVENTRSEDYLDFVLSEIQSPKLMFCYDSSHDWLFSADKGSILTKYGNRLSTIHLSDTKGTIDRHMLPFDGVIDWQLVADSFPRRSYRGCVTLEVMASRKEQSQSLSDFLASAYQRAIRLADMLSDDEE